ncbi:MAG: hypothetical protein ABI385_05260 [Lapillicoccus sp.]
MFGWVDERNRTPGGREVGSHRESFHRLRERGCLLADFNALDVRRRGHRLEFRHLLAAVGDPGVLAGRKALYLSCEPDHR